MILTIIYKFPKLRIKQEKEMQTLVCCDPLSDKEDSDINKDKDTEEEDNWEVGATYDDMGL